ncbi:hypothetical protein ACH4SP_10195 [Streptomyces sp. NPDC021093]|uniref:hypothetical protein n=1 Tax=Streptomyces sp. NPDC021093 TaxID=3365112 RepID=UPI0037B2BB74
MPQKPARTVAKLTATLGTLTAFVIAAAGPAAAATVTESRHSHPVAGTSVAMERLLENPAGATEDEILALIKAESETLYTKLVELRNLLKEKVDKLTPDAKTFVTGVIEKIKTLQPRTGEKPNLAEVRRAANEIIEQYKALSEEAKESLRENFPKLTSNIRQLRTLSAVLTQLENFLKIAQILQPLFNTQQPRALPAP